MKQVDVKASICFFSESIFAFQPTWVGAYHDLP